MHQLAEGKPDQQQFQAEQVERERRAVHDMAARRERRSRGRSVITAIPVISGSIVTAQVNMSSAREIRLSTGSVSRNISASSRETMVTPAAAGTSPRQAARANRSPVSRRMKAMCGA